MAAVFYYLVVQICLSSLDILLVETKPAHLRKPFRNFLYSYYAFTQNYCIL